MICSLSMGWRRVGAGQAGGHHGVPAVAFALVAGDGVKLAGIGDDDRGAQAGEVTADPRAVRAGLQRHGGGGIFREQQGEGRAVIGQRPFVEDPAGGVQHADVMAAVAQIQAEGEAAGRNRGGCEGGNDGRSDGRDVGWFVSLFFIGREYNPVSATGPLPSHSILLGHRFMDTLPSAQSQDKKYNRREKHKENKIHRVCQNYGRTNVI